MGFVTGAIFDKRVVIKLRRRFFQIPLGGAIQHLLSAGKSPIV
jgi:hypothetical protein